MRSSLANRSHPLGNPFYRIILQSNWFRPIDRKRLHTDLSPVEPIAVDINNVVFMLRWRHRRCTNIQTILAQRLLFVENTR